MLFIRLDSKNYLLFDIFYWCRFFLSRSNSRSFKRYKRRSRLRFFFLKKYKKDKYISFSNDREYRYVIFKEYKYFYKRKKVFRFRSISRSLSRFFDRYKSVSRKKYYKDRDYYYFLERYFIKRRRNGYFSSGRERYDKYRR